MIDESALDVLDEVEIEIDDAGRRDLWSIHRATIQNGARMFLEVGVALYECRAARLWEQEFTSYGSFLDWVRTQFPEEMSDKRIRRYIQCGGVLSEIRRSEDGQYVTEPLTMAQTDILAGLRPTERREAIESAKDEDGKIDTPALRELSKAIASRRQKPGREIVDEEGQPVDYGLAWEAFKDADVHDQIQAALTLARRGLRGMRQRGGGVWLEPRVVKFVEAAEGEWKKNMRPHAVCPDCAGHGMIRRQGAGDVRCELCRESGVLPLSRYEALPKQKRSKADAESGSLRAALDAASSPEARGPEDCAQAGE